MIMLFFNAKNYPRVSLSEDCRVQIIITSQLRKYLLLSNVPRFGLGSNDPCLGVMKEVGGGGISTISN